ncbi:hypothetical protein FNH22_18875 [Fulvivirga sp. M361]|uniref:hypothetical protein n=1 Tax=Fulvivirga sp. M361 TaxID=2594266 RepID=UPI00117B0B00|nr:hypothetical protein [Fulvivirga sp. M361]TRX54819.1 hypothetical protein FNH22_18875 [Fulvivirga sp. M361]
MDNAEKRLANFTTSMPGFLNYLPTRDEWNRDAIKGDIEVKFGKETVVKNNGYNRHWRNAYKRD